MRAALLQSLAAGALLTAGPALADRALLIGIDTYAESGLSLGGASSAADLAEMRELLTGALGYGDGDIAVLADRQATREAILKNFDSWLVDGSAAGDRVFLYFSGLGYFEEDTSGDEADKLDETLVPHDATLGSGEPPPIGLGISDDEIAALLKRLDGRKATVVIDAGHSGIVSREASDLPSGEHGLRAPAIGTKTRAIVVEPRAKAQKAEGAPLDTDGVGTGVAIFTATSGGQAPLIAGGYGVFTRAFAEAIRGKAADANHNGIVSNAEILAHVREASEAACTANKACALGLTPTLGPATAAGGTPMREEKSDDKLTADRILDYFAKGNSHGVTLEQHPTSPVKVGTKDIRFRVTSPAAGNLVLIDLSDDGTLVQLFPNEHTKDDAREGAILASSPITVPDDFYGIRFNATSPTSGTLIALVTTEPIQMPETVKTRKITVIAKEDATGTYLPEIAAALDKPADTHADTETRAIDWSVATLRYEIVK